MEIPEVAREHPADPAAVDAVLTASRSLIAVATRSLGAAAEEVTIAQYRALAARGTQRMAHLAAALDVAPSTAGRMCDRLVRKGLIRRHRARADRRAVLVSATASGRLVAYQATADRDHADPDSLRQHPPTPLPGYQLTEIIITARSPAAGRTMSDVTWPRGSTPVSVLRGHQLSPPRPQITLATGDRVSLLAVAPGGSSAQDPAKPDDIRLAGNGTGSRA
jgi:DNA-binding MarR family transcriptional regulator